MTTAESRWGWCSPMALRWPGSGQPVFVLEGSGGLSPGAFGGSLRRSVAGRIRRRLDGLVPADRKTRHGSAAARLAQGAWTGRAVPAFSPRRAGGGQDRRHTQCRFCPRKSCGRDGCRAQRRAHTGGTGAARSDRPGCGHRLERSEQARVGRSAAEFTATADARPGGWSFQGRTLERPLDLTGCKAIRAWVHGDGQGEQLKIQLFDGQGGYRDDYVPIDFTGWKQVTLATPALNSLRYDHVAALNLYYNSLPSGRTVSCRVDQIEAILEREHRQTNVLLEDFESPGCVFFVGPGETLEVSTHKKHGLQPAAFGVLACASRRLLDDRRAVRGGRRHSEPAAGRAMEQDVTHHQAVVLSS